MPTAVLGIWGLHLRFPAPLLIFVAACVVPTDAFKPALAKTVSLVFGILGVAAFSNGAIQMAALDRQTDALRAELAFLPDGQKVLIGFAAPETYSSFTAHAASIAVIERNAYVPNLFTNTSIVDVTPEMIDLHMPQSNPIYADEFAFWEAQPAVASKNGFWSMGFAADWPNRWDYVLYFKSAQQPALIALPLCEVSATPTIILYKTGACDKQ